jgi:hypothetical protein
MPTGHQAPPMAHCLVADAANAVHAVAVALAANVVCLGDNVSAPMLVRDVADARSVKGIFLCHL